MSKLETLRQHTLYKDLPSEKDAQFLMRRLSVFNWGTFSKIHTLRFADDGSLLLGPSGAGKSTLLDAISAMIVPPKKVRFNAAAEEGDKRGYDRTIPSYVRGAWADKGDKETRETTKQYLRPDGAISAIALEFGNRLGRTITLVRIFWITGVSANANVNMHYVVAEGSFDLKSLTNFDGEGRKLKKILGEMDGVRQHDTFASYQEHWCRIMGIEGEAPLELLHKTQSTKSLGDLNAFLRQFMLEEPETFAKADALIAEFGHLDESHKAVVTARQQIEVLRPARDNYIEHGRLTGEFEALGKLRDATEAFTQNMRVSLLEAAVARFTADKEGAEAQFESNKPLLDAANDRLLGLRERHMEAGGADISVIEAKMAENEATRQARSQNKGRAETHCLALGLGLADNPLEFAEQIAQARAIVQDGQVESESQKTRENDLAVEVHELLKQHRELKDEIKELEGSTSNVDGALQRVRAVMCAELKIPMSQLVFVGELLQVRREHYQEWAGAAERLLGGFGRDLLVDERHHRQVAQWVDKTNLGLKLVYHPVKQGVAPARRELGQNSIVYKLERKPHAFSDWVHAELINRFDYECVANAIELAKRDFTITAAGQIRHARGRTEKDDRRSIHDKKTYVLGFDSREKLELMRAEADDVASKLADARVRSKALESERQADFTRRTAASKLADMSWTDIDVTTMVTLIAEQAKRIEELRAGNNQLHDIEGQIAEAKEAHGKLALEQGKLSNTIRDRSDEIIAYGGQLQRAKIEAGALESKYRDALRSKLPEDWKPTLASLVTDVHRVKEQIAEERSAISHKAANLGAEIKLAFGQMLTTWPEEAGSLQSNLDSAPDFFAKLKRLEEDGLPALEAKFRRLLSEQGTNRLVELNKHVLGGRREIDLRLAEVNDALNAVSYNPDSFIRITPSDIHLPEVTDFRDRAKLVFEAEGYKGQDPEQDEIQFVHLRQLVADLKGEDPDKKRWRERVLDIRQHVEFNAEEVDRRTEEQIEVYAGSSGKSGGQRQKLTATCLAAALRYRLAGSAGGAPTYTTVVLDEAFTKTDDTFTRTCMQVFKKLGFQMIVATPIKSVMTLEEFIGGANFVMIENRNKSAVKQIEYLEAEHKLNLSDKDRREAELDYAND